MVSVYKRWPYKGVLINKLFGSVMMVDHTTSTAMLWNRSHGVISYSIIIRVHTAG